MAYLYRHIRLDKNIPFYIGIGSNNDGLYSRAYKKWRTNKHWMSITNKYSYKVEILLDGLTWEQACEKEKEFIQLYGRRIDNSGWLVNRSLGGDGTPGVKPVITEERNKKISETSKKQYASGRKKVQLGVKWSDEKKKKHKHWVGRKHTEESKKKMSQLAMGNKKGLGKPCSEEKKRKISIANKGKIHTAETRLKNSLARKGKPSPKRGKKYKKATIGQPTLF